MNNSMISMLYIILSGLIFLVIVLSAIFIILKMKEKKKNEEKSENKLKLKPVETKNTTKVAKEYETKTIFDFMEFEDVKDNMIIQKNGKRFLMAIECQGVNYDLMSDVEKAATEQGFAVFLNTLKDPIQIYIQTRTVNLEKNIQKYKEKLGKIKDSLNLKEYKLKQYMQEGGNNEKILKDKNFEVLREKNLFEYGKDIIADTERMSLNKNVLKKKYYIIMGYFYEPTDANGEDILSKEEIADIAFSNLYTKAISMIRVLAGIGIVGKTLNSFELVDLLYNAYNRDDSETFGIEKALDAGFNEIYIDSQNVISKKIEALNKEIKLKAEAKVNDVINEIKDENNQELNDIEANIENIIVDLAKKMIEDNENNIPRNVREKALKKIQGIEETKQKKGEDKSDGKKQTKESSRKRRAG